MLNAQELWRNRLNNHSKEMGRYLRLMFNDHFAFAMFFFLAGLAYVYQQWLADLSNGFPSALVIAVILGLLLTYSPIRTMLKEADLVFLLPAEAQLGSFFRNGIIYSYITHLFTLLFIFVALGPLYFTTYPERSGSDFLVLGVVVVVFKAWNILSHWWEINSRVGWSGYIDPIFRTLLNGLTIYFIVVGNAWIFAVITTLLFFGVMMYDYTLAKKRRGIAWDLLIEKEQARMQTFYRIANLFTDVPHLKKTIKKRHWLAGLVKSPIPFQQNQTFDYMYRITFVRSSDYLGMYVRLLVIAGALVYWVPNFWFQLGFAFLFLYMSGFQMVTLWHHHKQLEWLDLYPVPLEQRKRALLKWLFQLMLVKTFVLGIVFLLLWNLLGVAIVWVGGAIFSYGMVYKYLVHRMN
ncbi:ABC transporter permease [Pontibacillus yanchengensis]|uniref:ABC transporter permease n=2 Tax=Pontibacillus yanchengensis TaxID=462910 RepID=A0ACC7VC11_9BACI|nr:ABC transporter permease [Pontibacillus yanchengensis]MYL32353.1 ABC transporter permease [Pontibacillus yanchengensis]MYL52933.1 ABC transporter permease [Pontibacillus yanchengensis]